MMIPVLTMNSTTQVVVVVIVTFVIWFLSSKLRRKKLPNEPPCVTSSPLVPIPVIGHLIEFFFLSPNSMIKRCYEKYGSVFTIPIFHKRLTFLIGPEAQEVFFQSSDDVLSQQEVYDFMQPVFGKNIVYDASKKDRQVQFQAMANGLRTTRLKAYVEKIEDETRKYLHSEWNNDTGVVDLLKALSELTILTASRCLHGDDVRAHLFKEVEQLYHDLDHGLTPLTVFWPDAPTAGHKKRNKAREEMVKLFTKVIAERKEFPNRTDGTDILSMFMDIKYKDGRAISEAEVTGLLIALLFAGQHTSCISSTWTSLFIANDPALLERIRAEQDSILKGQWDKPLNFDDVNNMELLHNCMREALRMCPTFIMILRRAERDISIKVKDRAFDIPKGDFVVLSPTVSMRLKSTFPNPDTFDPDRFAPPREEHKVPYSYLGFGGGMHSCMGQAFAFLQVKTILSILLREYDIERIAENMPAIGYDDMVVGPKGDCTVRYTKRKVNV